MTHMLPHYVDIDDLSMHASHLDALTAMLHTYHDAAAEGGDVLSHEVMSSYLWQMQHTIFQLQESIKRASDNQIPNSRVLSEVRAQQA